MSAQLIRGIAANTECDNFIAAHQPCPADREGPPQPVEELSDEALGLWLEHCMARLVDTDAEYLRVANERAYWYMRARDAQRVADSRRVR